jgi:hypothetical protein
MPLVDRAPLAEHERLGPSSTGVRSLNGWYAR